MKYHDEYGIAAVQACRIQALRSLQRAHILDGRMPLAMTLDVVLRARGELARNKGAGGNE